MESQDSSKNLFVTIETKRERNLHFLHYYNIAIYIIFHTVHTPRKYSLLSKILTYLLLSIVDLFLLISFYNKIIIEKLTIS